jgi:hypothetical protein
MDARELRIKNIIGWRLGTGQLITGMVHAIEPDRIAISEKITTIFESGEPATGQSFMLLSGIEPIELTEEWLKRLGFKRKNNAWELAVGGTDFSLWNPPGDLEIRLNDTILCPKTEYVHQLQNLYFALTNSELTLKETVI